MTSHVLQKPLLPVTVQDQIRLWELERNRIKTQDGKLGSDLESCPRIVCYARLTRAFRLPIHRVRVPSRLRVRPQLRTTA